MEFAKIEWKFLRKRDTRIVIVMGKSKNKNAENIIGGEINFQLYNIN